MEEKKEKFSGEASAFGYAKKYLRGLIGAAVKTAAGYLIAGAAALSISDTVGDHFATQFLDIMDVVYAFMVVISVINAFSACYKTGKKQLYSPRGAEGFKYYNGAVIGFIAALPFIVTCIIGMCKGYTYYAADEQIDFALFVCYLFAYPFTEHSYRISDFSFAAYMALALVPMAVCEISYLFPKFLSAIKEKRKNKKENSSNESYSG